MGIESTENLLWLIFVLPLLGAAGLLLAGRRADRWGHIPAIILAAASFALSLAMCIGMAGREVAERAAGQRLFSWVPVGGLQVDFGLQLDQLSVCFVLLITGVGTLIHIYSVRYMADDPDRRKFFAFLNLFLAAMLLLVLADNYLGLYLGWEGVGLASYLLIGFWQHRPAAATAAKKAFVVNRVGDVGLAIALMIMFATFGAVSFEAVFSGADAAGQGVLTALGFVLLLAACGKSAQVPLQSWLGDAMEGPTPVSALIHAATMVTAGVYLITRSAAIFDRAPAAQIGVVVVGAVTLLFGAIIGCAKDDIKKALAASTMSQIGYMVLAAGLGPAGYAFAILHLLTHGFFKAGLFLGAGSVMHAMDDETDMRRYGGLRRLLPITFATFGLGYLALIGVPPLSGFFSKDHIIEVAFGSPGAKGLILGLVTLVGAGLTAFYMTRVMAMTFFGKPRWSGDPSPHEAPPSMTGPMILLAIGSVAAGWLLAAGDTLVDWLTPVTAAHPAPGLISTGHDGVLDLPTWAMTVIILAVVAAGVALGWQRYRGEIPVTAPADVSPLTVAARRDLYGDTVNEQLLMLPGRQLTTNLVVLEDYGIDGFTDAVGSGVQETSSRLRGWQSGYVRSYALSTFAGALLVVATVMVVTLT